MLSMVIFQLRFVTLACILPLFVHVCSTLIVVEWSTLLQFSANCGRFGNIWYCIDFNSNKECDFWINSFLVSMSPQVPNNHWSLYIATVLTSAPSTRQSVWNATLPMFSSQTLILDDFSKNTNVQSIVCGSVYTDVSCCFKSHLWAFKPRPCLPQVARRLSQNFGKLMGCDVAIAGDLPPASGEGKPGGTCCFQNIAVHPIFPKSSNLINLGVIKANM